MKFLLLIFLTLFLTGCLDDINLNQGKKAELKEIEGTTYFISADGKLFEQKEGLFVEIEFVDKKVFEKEKTYKKNKIANLPYSLEVKLKYIDGKLYQHFYAQPIFSNQKRVFKKIGEKNEKFVEENIEKLKPLISNDYINNKCYKIENQIEFDPKENRSELALLLPVNKLRSQCKKLKLFQEQYRKASKLNSKIIEYNKVILENLEARLDKLNNYEIVLKNDRFELDALRYSKPTITVNKFGNSTALSTQKNVNFSFKKYVKINNINARWLPSDEYNKLLKTLKKHKADIDILSNIDENLLKLNDPSLTQITN